MSYEPATSPLFRAFDFSNDNTHHLLIAATGSVATITLPLILQGLSSHPNLTIRIILTDSALQFFQATGESLIPYLPTTTSKLHSEADFLNALLKIPNVKALYTDKDEWISPWKRNDPILHIELRRWAHLLLIAPLSANTMAKIVGGFADNLLTTVVRAWDTDGTLDRPDPMMLGKKKIIVAPAMNTAMWKQSITMKQIAVLEEEWGPGSPDGGWFEVLRPEKKQLACGDVGDGAMRGWKEIVEILKERL